MARCIIRRIGRIDLGQAPRERIGHQRNIARVGLDMRIAAGMHIAVGAIQARRHFQLAHIIRRLEITRLAGLDSGVAGLAQQNRQPADFQLRSRAYQHIGAAGAGDQARPRLDLMRVLQGIGRGINRYLLPAQRLGQRAPLRFARQYIDRGARRQRGAEQQQQTHYFHQHFHFRLLECVGAMRAQAHLILQEHLIVGRPLARFILRELEPNAAELAWGVVEHQAVFRWAK